MAASTTGLPPARQRGVGRPSRPADETGAADAEARDAVAGRIDPAAGKAQGDQTDGELVRETLDGRRAAFDVLVRRHQKQAMSVSLRYLSNNNDALEVTQDAFLKAFKNLATLQTPDAFAGWLMRIVANLSLNYRRGRKLRQNASLDDLVENTGDIDQSVGGGSEYTAGGQPLGALAGKELGEKLREALARLPEKQRLALTMFTIDELPQKDVAEALDCSVEAVKWHVFQARKKLKEMLKDVV